MRRNVTAAGVVGWSAAALLIASCTVFDGLQADLRVDSNNPRTGNPNGADNGMACGVGYDCKSGVCNANVCAAPTPTDGVLNGDETGTDCGGTAPKCPLGEGCKVSSDCAALSCVAGKCGERHPDDGLKNGDETDVDCGGAGDAKRCADGRACIAGTDCGSFVCTGGRCIPPAPTDGVKNGDEGDIDCGGSTTGAPRCEAGKSCNNNADCASDGCDYQKKCAVNRSCTAHMGGDTCGTGEVGAPGAVHESCCLSLPLANGVKLDKYKATAGRVRAMVERTNGDVKAWYMANRATLSAGAIAQIDPFVDKLPSGLTGDLGINEQLGSFIYVADSPSKQQGCFVAGNGTHTYWLPDAVNMFYGDSPQGFPQEVLDTKPINCITMPLAAAFCAWDGGRLQTFAENKEMYGPQQFPWGTSPVAGGYGKINDVFVKVGPADKPVACPSCDVTAANWSNNYEFPAANPAKLFDYSFYISAPGRFPVDKGPRGHMDAGGDMLEHTSTNGMVADMQGRTPTFKWGVQGSWEGHTMGYGGFSFVPMTKYGKTGLRCARD